MIKLNISSEVHFTLAQMATVAEQLKYSSTSSQNGNKTKEFFGLQVVIISLSQNKRRHLQVVNIYELKPLWRRELQPESETKHQGNFSVSCSNQRIFGRKN